MPRTRYWFDRVPPIPSSANIIERDYAGAFHTAEVPYIFKNLDVRRWPWTEADRRLAELVSGAWTSFARTGDPNAEGLPYWPEYEPDRPSTMVWDLAPHVAWRSSTGSTPSGTASPARSPSAQTSAGGPAT
jgi:para-nitrobenzyl esterase